MKWPYFWKGQDLPLNGGHFAFQVGNYTRKQCHSVCGPNRVTPVISSVSFSRAKNPSTDTDIIHRFHPSPASIDSRMSSLISSGLREEANEGAIAMATRHWWYLFGVCQLLANFKRKHAYQVDL